MVLIYNRDKQKKIGIVFAKIRKDKNLKTIIIKGVLVKPLHLEKLTLALIVVIASHCYVGSARAEESCDSEKRFSMVMSDDNPFLNVAPKSMQTEDDFGYTYGVNLKMEKMNPCGQFSKNERWTLSYSTDLYTKDVTPAGENLFPNTPQEFNEVTTLKVQWDDEFNQINSGKFYKIIGAGLGEQNDKDSNSPHGLFQQQKWHEAKHSFTPDQTNIYKYVPGDKKQYYGSVTAALGKVITFNDKMKDCHCEIDRIKVEGGAELLSVHDGSRAYILAEVNHRIFQADETTTSLNAKIEASRYSDGNYDVKKTLGLQFDRRKWSFETGFTFISGPQNVQFLEHVDSEAIWYGRISRKIGVKK